MFAKKEYVLTSTNNLFNLYTFLTFLLNFKQFQGQNLLASRNEISILDKF